MSVEHECGETTFLSVVHHKQVDIALYGLLAARRRHADAESHANHAIRCHWVA